MEPEDNPFASEGSSARMQPEPAPSAPGHSTNAVQERSSEREDLQQGNEAQTQQVAPSIQRVMSEQPIRLRDRADRTPLIHIIDAQKTNEGGTASYITYIIRSTHGDTRRRYSEFESLREILTRLHPVLIIPPIPPHHSLSDYAVKQTKAKEDASVIGRRRRMLAVFLNRLDRHPILGADRVFLRFLDPHSTWPEILHSEPVTLLPKNVLRASAKDPTDSSSSNMYSALPVPPAGATLQDPDQRFIDSETFTSKFSAHLSGSLEKVSRRLMKRWTELGSDEADLGGLLNGFGLIEQNGAPDLAQAIEKAGQAIDSTYVHTSVMLQEWERLYTEPLAEYTQFSAIIKQLLKYRHNKHVQFEMTRDVLVSKRAHLEDLERSEAEAKRLDQALDRAINRVKPIDANGEVDPSPPFHSPTVTQSDPSQSTSMSASSRTSEQSATPSSSTMSPTKSSSRSNSPAIGFFGALSHSISNVIDSDPEASRRSGIGKTRELIQHLEEGVGATQTDLRFASQTIQADLDRFQRQKVIDMKEMTLNFVAFHKEWCEKNLKQWLDAKAEIEKISGE